MRTLESNHEYLSGKLDLLTWMIHPITPKQFFEDYWEKNPLVIKRKDPEYYAGLFSEGAVRDRIAQQKLEKRKEDVAQDYDTRMVYGRDVNLAKFNPKTKKKDIYNKLGQQTQNADGSISYAEVCVKTAEYDTALKQGVSAQVMHPQRWYDPVWALLADLEKTFGAVFGSNAYITPADSRGFAPHFDDVEVFMLQLEGAKRWSCWEYRGTEYPPTLSREYSRDFVPDELKNFHKVVDEVLLEAGDLLYFPRGIIHFGESVKSDVDSRQGSGGCPPVSHHITVSTYQK